MALLADSHCHILDPRLVHKADEIVSRMADDGLEFIIEISASVAESHESLAFAARHENVYCTIGVHPHMIHEYTDEFERWATVVAEKTAPMRRKIVAVGECGLEYYHLPHPCELQREIFTRQIRLAHSMGLPLVVHMRDAFDDTLNVLVENRDQIKNGLLFHCFSEGADEVAKIRRHFDAYFAFGGAITYDNKSEATSSHGKCAGKSNSAIRAVGLDRMLLETDAPYLTPKGAGGKKVINEPKNVRHVAQYIADLLETPFETVAAKTLCNTKKFFHIK